MVEISGNKAKPGKRKRELETKRKRISIPGGRGRKVFSFLFFFKDGERDTEGE